MQDLDSTTSSRPFDSLARRRDSQASRRVSSQSARPMRIAASNSSARSVGTQNQDGQDGTPPPTGIRQRLASMVQRGTEAASSFTSPLAQIYQPLVVDDDIVEQETDPVSSMQPMQSAPPPPSISYGPSMRRRLSSMHRFPPMAPMDMGRRVHSVRGQNNDGHVLDTVPVEESPRSTEIVISDAEEQAKEEGSTPPERASQVLAGEGMSGMVPQVADRLAKIEERQKRMEELLLQLSEDLRQKKR